MIKFIAMTRIASNTDMKSSEDIFSLHRSSSISGNQSFPISDTCHPIHQVAVVLVALILSHVAL
jgi:hypothetical protein